MKFRHPKNGDVITHKTDEDKEPRTMFVKILGPDSPLVKREIMNAQKRSQKRNSEEDISDEEFDDMIKADVETLTKIVTGGLVFAEGQWIDIENETPEGRQFIRKLFLGISHFRNQALQFALDRGNFIAG